MHYTSISNFRNLTVKYSRPKNGCLHEKGILMSETLISRVMRIVSGNLHDGVAALESHEAETVMRQAVREIEKTISDVRAEARIANGNRLLAKKRLEMTDAKLAELSQKARVALSENREDLAEAAVSRQLDLEAQIPVLEKAEAASRKTNEEIEGFTEALLGRKAEMETELETFVEMRKSPDFRLNGITAANENKFETRADEATSAFDQAMKSGNATVGYAAADHKTVVQMGELNSIIRKNQINERLEALKAENDQEHSA